MRFINSIKEKILARKKTTALIAITGLVVLILPFFVNAYDPIGDSLKGALFSIIGLIFSLILWFEGLLLQLAGTTIDTVLGSALAVHTSDVVQDAWALSRDVANMIFIIALLVIAFATIFNIEAYQYKALLPKLIMGVLLVNFSRTIATICIEFSNLLTAAFLNFDQSRTSTAVIMAILGVHSVSELKGKAGIAGLWIDDAGMLMALIAIVVIVGLLVVVLTAFAGMLILRTIMLLVLIVISPLAFAMGVLPATKSMLDEWWQHFIQYILYTPLAAFGLYLSLRAAQEINNYGQGEGGGMLGVKPASITGKAAENASLSTSVIPITFPGDPRQVYNFCLVLGLLFFTVMMIQKAGGFLAAFGIGLAKMGVLALPKAARLLGAKAIGHRASRFMAGRGKEGGWMDKLGQGAAKLFGKDETKQKKWGEFARTIPKLFSPAVVSQAWNARQERLDRLAFGESTGFVRNIMNKFFDPNDKTNYAFSAHEQHVGEEVKNLQMKNQDLNHPMLRADLLDAVEAGDREKTEAALRLLVKTNNWNEIYRMLGEEPALAKHLHSAEFNENEQQRNEATLTAERQRRAAAGEAPLTADDEADIKSLKSFSIESRMDTLTHLMGKETAQRLEQDFGENGKTRGDFNGAEGYDYYRDKGLTPRSPEARAYASAVENSKLTSGKKMTMFRGTIADLAYNRRGEEEALKMSDNFKAMALNSGFSADDLAERNISMLSADVKKTLTSTNVEKDVRRLCSVDGINENYTRFRQFMQRKGESEVDCKKRMAENAVSTLKLHLYAKYAKMKRGGNDGAEQRIINETAGLQNDLINAIH